MTESQPIINRIAYVGNYYPRKCGIATFTTDLSEAISTENPNIASMIVAINDREGGYDYPAAVRFELSENDAYSYKVAAEYLNLNGVDVVSLQHEYGIFGGQSGSYILHLLRELRVPVVTTLHTILKDPDPAQLRILKEIGRLSSRVVAMSELGAEFLRDVYKIPPEKIDFIHHGIPDIPFVDPNFYKDHFNVEGKTVLLTFGLLSRNKGIENVIKALPAIVKTNPDLVYLVVGATHPNVQTNEGESYRESLEKLASELGVGENVLFDNRFVARSELLEYIGAADIYITP
jgi:glycosyltransferase involved in cell wall biosynthesis